MQDKFHLTLEQNIFLAKKMLVENIYSASKIENCNVTFPDTQTILQGVSVANIKMDDVEVILNLRDAWKFVLNSVKEPLTSDYICKINSLIARNQSLDWGVLRYGEVGINGVDYIPKIPIREEVQKDLDKLLKITCITERAIKLFLYCCRSQLFWDGNKRTSLLAANKILISEGKGLLLISEKDLLEFNTRLTDFYNTNDYIKIDQFLYDNCIVGISFKK